LKLTSERNQIEKERQKRASNVERSKSKPQINFDFSKKREKSK
jgi:hypothetical protein